MLGVSIILQLIGPSIVFYLVTHFEEITFFNTLYRLSNLCLNLIPYVGMICLYVLALDEQPTELTVEK